MPSPEKQAEFETLIQQIKHNTCIREYLNLSYFGLDNRDANRLLNALRGSKWQQHLKCLYLSWNRLTELNVQGLTNLEYLFADRNNLTHANVRGLTQLVYLNLQDNQLSLLDVQGLTHLSCLLLDDNPLNRFARLLLAGAIKDIERVTGRPINVGYCFLPSIKVPNLGRSTISDRVEEQTEEIKENCRAEEPSEQATLLDGNADLQVNSNQIQTDIKNVPAARHKIKFRL